MLRYLKKADKLAREMNDYWWLHHHHGPWDEEEKAILLDGLAQVRAKLEEVKRQLERRQGNE